MLIDVVITDQEHSWCKRIANLRFKQSPQLGSQLNDYHGCLAELALCKALGVEWTASVNTFKGEADVPPDIEVRFSIQPSYGLIIRPDDLKAKGNRKIKLPPGKRRRYVFVSKGDDLGGGAFSLSIRGWTYGFMAPEIGEEKDPGGHGKPAWFIRPNKLYPPLSLLLFPPATGLMGSHSDASYSPMVEDFPRPKPTEQQMALSKVETPDEEFDDHIPIPF